MRDQQIADLIARENQSQVKGVELIASENYTSEQVMEARGSILTNKYAEGLPRRRYYGGCEVVDEVERWPSTGCASCSALNGPTFSRTPAPLPTRRSCSRS